MALLAATAAFPPPYTSPDSRGWHFTTNRGRPALSTTPPSQKVWTPSALAHFNRVNLSATAMGWFSQLAPADRTAWDTYAAATPITTWNGAIKTLNGFEMFLYSNLPYIAFNRSHVPPIPGNLMQTFAPGSPPRPATLTLTSTLTSPAGPWSVTVTISFPAAQNPRTFDVIYYLSTKYSLKTAPRNPPVLTAAVRFTIAGNTPIVFPADLTADLNFLGNTFKQGQNVIIGARTVLDTTHPDTPVFINITTS